MIIKTILRILTFSIALTAGAVAAQTKEPDPLFADNSILTVRISAPFKQIMKDRPDEEYVPGTFQLVTSDGTTIERPIGVRTRGEFRRQKRVCEFAPLRINFDKQDDDTTVLDKQDKLKLVTHCEDRSERYEQSVLAEYLAYRILNVMTPYSFRVRLMRVTYVYTDDKNSETESYAFMIEHKDRLAKRLGTKEKETRDRLSILEVDSSYLSLTSVFQYLIGNTDFSPVQARPNENCCHNHVLFGEGLPYLSIPYDFDLAGIVDAKYAQPSANFNIKSVRQRLYRGRCINHLLLPNTIKLYQAKRGEIEALISQQAELIDRKRKTILKYVESFYETIDDPKRVDSRLAKACI